MKKLYLIFLTAFLSCSTTSLTGANEGNIENQRPVDESIENQVKSELAEVEKALDTFEASCKNYMHDLDEIYKYIKEPEFIQLAEKCSEEKIGTMLGTKNREKMANIQKQKLIPAYTALSAKDKCLGSEYESLHRRCGELCERLTDIMQLTIDIHRRIHCRVREIYEPLGVETQLLVYNPSSYFSKLQALSNVADYDYYKK